MPPDAIEPDGDTAEEPPPLRVAIVGVGLIGGSLAAALGEQGAYVTAVVSSAAEAEQVRQADVADEITEDLATGVADAEIVVLAAPVGEIVRLVPLVGADMHDGATLLDVGSTKREIVAAMDALPESIRAVGGHPMAGSERQGVEHANPALFEGATFVLSRTQRSDDEVVEGVSALVRAIGAVPLELDAERHDAAVAAASDLPYMLSCLLVRVAAGAGAADDVAQLAATGFAGVSRLAAGDPAMWTDILGTNADHVDKVLASLEREIAGLRGVLRDDGARGDWLCGAQQSASKFRQ